MAFFVYVLYSSALDKFYKGQTSNVHSRLADHNSAKVGYTAKGYPWRLIWSTKKDSRSEAVLLEQKLKNLSRARLIKLMLKYSSDIESDDEFSFLKKLSSC